MALILCIESTADFCSVSLFDDNQMISFTSSSEKYAHSRFLAVLIDDCLNNKGFGPKDLEAIAISSGPGSYTGLRVGASIAKGMCYALSIPLIALDSLHILAFPYIKADSATYSVIIPSIDARRDEAYISHFSFDGLRLTASSPHIFTAESFLEYDEEKLIICGNAADKASLLLGHRQHIQYEQTHPSAQSMGHLACQRFQASEFVDSAYFEPNYIKSPNITTPKKPLIS